MSEPLFCRISEGFSVNVTAVLDLTLFDRFVLDFAIHNIGLIDQRLQHLHPESGPGVAISNSAGALTNIRGNESLRKQYAQMLNQCDVFLV